MKKEKNSSRKIKKEVKKQNYKNKLFLFFILIIGLVLATIFVGPCFINGSDNYEYVYSAYLFANGRFNELPADSVLATRYFLLGGIALFYKILGFNAIASASFGIFCFLLTLPIIYLIGKEIYNETAGLLASLFYSFFPLAIIQSSCVGDDIPAVLLSSIAILFLVKGIKEEKKKFYAICGFFSTTSILASTSGGIIAAFSFLFILFHCIFSKNKKGIFAFLSGVAIGVVAIILVSSYITNDPFHVFRVILEWYPNPVKHSFSKIPNFELVYDAVFPYSTNFIEKFIWALTNIFSFRIGSIFNFINTRHDVGHFNFFGYFSIISLVYLIVVKEKRAIIPSLWFLFGFAYLSFGPTAISNELLFIAYAPRFNLIFVPAICLIIAVAFANLFEKVKDKKIKVCVHLLCFFLILFLFIFSFLEIFYVSYSKFKIVIPLIQIANIINYLPANATIYKSSLAIPIEIYLNFKRSFPAISVDEKNLNCSSFQNKEYIIMKRNNKLEKSCNLSLIYESVIPKELEEFHFYDDIGEEYLYNLSLYKVER